MSNGTASQPKSAVTAANVLSGEKSFRTVQFAITGDPEVDLMSGCMACIPTDPYPCIPNAKAIAQVFEYLAARYQRIAEDVKRQEEAMRTYQHFPANSPKTSEMLYPPQWGTTTGGTGAMVDPPTPYRTTNLSEPEYRAFRASLTNAELSRHDAMMDARRALKSLGHRDYTDKPDTFQSPDPFSKQSST